MRFLAMLGMVGVTPVAVIAVIAGNFAAHPLFETATAPMAAKGGALEVLGVTAALGAVTCFIGLAGRWGAPTAVGAIGVALAAVGLLAQWPFEDVIRLRNEVAAAALVGVLAAALLALANLIGPLIRSSS